MEKYKIVVVDVVQKALVLRDRLEKEGLRISMIHLGGDSAHEPSGPVDLMMLDTLVSNEAAQSVFNKMLSLSDVPVMFFSAGVGDANQLLGLEVGVRDYLTRLSLPREKLKGILEKVRESQVQHPGKKLSVGPIVVDIACRSAMVAASELCLTPIEFELLRLFLSAPGIVFTRSDLASRIYHTDCVNRQRTIDCHICNLRKKIAFHLPDQTIIRTVYGAGYSLQEPAEA